MRKEILYSMTSPYREELKITGYKFGHGKKAACIVGSIRGNEVQQLYICSQLIKKLSELEAAGNIVSGNEIMVVPSGNHHSMNIGKRFWAVDNTDINRMFPGYDQGETTQRIAAGLFTQVKDYEYGIQFASFYMPGDFVPHVRMMDTGNQSPSLASLFSLPYVVVRKPRPIDTTKLNYNWQIWETNAGGLYRRLKKPGEEVHMGEVLAEILHPYEGEVISRILSPTEGIIFFAHKKPLVTESEVIYKIIRRLYE